ncbi:dTDP-glucose 4,6-dehydratase [Alloscardovia criceti]|uniref:dTDP-glucose 4,6-dehydratase n=1 Tax=Alloscardovia criceti TaxID=356828 RepID=UPI0003A492F9|nr:dTDP-glucose 4,6-dehydratase [Alloscardovia criceti]
MKTLLVTGGAGFIGSNFVRYSRAHYPQTHLIVLDALTYAGNLSNIADLLSDTTDTRSGVEFIHASINDPVVVDAVMQRVDAVVHFAAESHNDRAIEQPTIFYETNVMGTLNLLQAAQKYGVRFHHISTDEVYGDTPLDSTEKFTETSPYKPSSPYAASKAASDHMVRAWVRTYGLRATISNCSNNYGAYQHIEKFIPRAVTNALSGLPMKLYGDGLAVRDWIHVDDQCSAIWAILERGKPGETYLVGADRATSNIDVARMISDTIDVEREHLQVIVDQEIPDVHITHVRNRLGADRRYALNASKIQHELGWKPQKTDFAEELKETIYWYARHAAWWQSLKTEVEQAYARSGQ